MVAESKLSSDNLIKELGGCGLFQIVMVILVYLPHIPWAFSTLFMSFGSYNPGWRCLDERTKSDSFYTHTVLDLEREKLAENNLTGVVKIPEYITDSCRGYQWCKRLEFNPEASTIVTQFGLACHREWILSLIIPIQMCGGLLGGLIVASFGDGFGRKKTIYGLLLCHVVLSVACMFSVNVEMFITLRFFIGANDVILGKLPIAYAMEFVPARWRMIAGTIPVWTVGNILFAVSAMMTHDWFQMSLIIAALSLVCILPVFWVPESLRWLAVVGDTEGLLSAGEKISRLNNKQQLHDQWCELSDEVSKDNHKSKHRYGILNLFKAGYAHNAVILGFSIMSADVLYFAAHFGAIIMPGNVYINLILLAVTEVPANLIAAFVPNIVGRRVTITLAMMVQAFCLFSAVAVELILDKNSGDSAIVALVLAGKFGTCIARSVLNVLTVEIYPTVIRSTASGYTGVMAMVGSMIAPLVVARRQNEVYICYLLMSVLANICSCLVLMVPETNGAPLHDTWVECEDLEEEEAAVKKEKEKVAAAKMDGKKVEWVESELMSVNNEKEKSAAKKKEESKEEEEGEWVESTFMIERKGIEGDRRSIEV